jgi:hypothetical protein
MLQVANVNSSIKSSLIGIHAFFVEVGDGGGCILEGDPERKTLLHAHSVFIELKSGKGTVLVLLNVGQALPFPLGEPELRQVLLHPCFILLLPLSSIRWDQVT